MTSQISTNRLNRRALLRAGAGATAGSLVGALVIRPGTGRASTGGLAPSSVSMSTEAVPVAHSKQFTEWVQTLPTPTPSDHAHLPPAPRHDTRRPRQHGTLRPENSRRS